MTYHTGSGVSLGTILGPPLIHLMINNLSLVPKNARRLLYAEDLKYVHGVEQRVDSEPLQRDALF